VGPDSAELFPFLVLIKSNEIKAAVGDRFVWRTGRPAAEGKVTPEKVRFAPIGLSKVLIGDHIGVK
jgi:hypothetical protein